MVVSFSLADLDEEKERESWGSLPELVELLRLKPVEASILFFLV